MESDEELMRAVAHGDERALASLVERYAARIHAFLTRVTGDRDDADDLLQDTWMRVARGARGFDPARARLWHYRATIADAKRLIEEKFPDTAVRQLEAVLKEV